ncbi:hypothetical protein EGW08_015646 [Elysia chlorotica]|uniref:Uncharacterized protein n=1 Tax=Elysia chlorotica TaxID=188477 RepID=A0A3S0ZK30_ELYCH|nr:hypothetical protein EGW08_015646 [Elysia chlorotica]
MSKPSASNMLSNISILVTFFGLVMLALEVASSPQSSKDGSAFVRVRRDGETQGVVQDEGSHPAPAESSDSKLDADKSSSQLNCSLPSSANATVCIDDGHMNSILSQMSENKGMLWRTLCVSLGVTGIVVVYFVVRAVRLRKRRSKSRKYGIITQHDQGDVEMEPLGDGNDDDDDYTVFEMNGKR